MSYDEEFGADFYRVDFTPADDLWGSFDVLQEDAYVDGYVVDDGTGFINEEAAVWRPDVEGEKFPLISFSHGFGMGDEFVYGHSPLLNDVASSGYVVVAHKSGGGMGGVGNYSPDQLRTLEWARTSELADYIDFDAPVGVMGYSMGGGATLNSAADKGAIKANNIGVGVAVAPMTQEVVVATAEYYAEYYD